MDPTRRRETWQPTQQHTHTHKTLLNYSNCFAVSNSKLNSTQARLELDSSLGPTLALIDELKYARWIRVPQTQCSLLCLPVCLSLCPTVQRENYNNRDSGKNRDHFTCPALNKCDTRYSKSGQFHTSTTATTTTTETQHEYEYIEMNIYIYLYIVYLPI